MAKSKHRFKRRSNANLKARRARSWLRGEDRKKLVQVAQKAAHKANEALTAAGLPTPWQAAQKARADRRAHDPVVQQRRRARENQMRSAS